VDVNQHGRNAHGEEHKQSDSGRRDPGATTLRVAWARPPDPWSGISTRFPSPGGLSMNVERIVTTSRAVDESCAPNGRVIEVFTRTDSHAPV
jgi:hypothetical protein